jgi:hypothetical protein
MNTRMRGARAFTPLGNALMRGARAFTPLGNALMRGARAFTPLGYVPMKSACARAPDHEARGAGGRSAQRFVRGYIVPPKL